MSGSIDPHNGNYGWCSINVDSTEWYSSAELYPIGNLMFRPTVPPPSSENIYALKTDAFRALNALCPSRSLSAGIFTAFGALSIDPNAAPYDGMGGLAHAANALLSILIFCVWFLLNMVLVLFILSLSCTTDDTELYFSTVGDPHTLSPSSDTNALRVGTLGAAHALYPLFGDIVSRAAVASSMYYNDYAVTRNESYLSMSAAMASSAAAVSSNTAIALSGAAVVSSNAVTDILDVSSMSYNNYADDRNKSYSSLNAAIASSAAMVSSNTAIDGNGNRKDANDNGDGYATTVRHAHLYHTHSIDLQMGTLSSPAFEGSIASIGNNMAPIFDEYGMSRPIASTALSVSISHPIASAALSVASHAHANNDNAHLNNNNNEHGATAFAVASVRVSHPVASVTLSMASYTRSNTDNDDNDIYGASLMAYCTVLCLLYSSKPPSDDTIHGLQLSLVH